MNQRERNRVELLVLLATLLPGCTQHGTVYAPGYSEENFDQIRLGDTSNHVVALLGMPLRIDRQDFSEQWAYLPRGESKSPSKRGLFSTQSFRVPVLVISFDSTGNVIHWYGDSPQPTVATNKLEVLKVYGPATQIKTNHDLLILNYTLSKSAESFPVRAVILDGSGLVSDKRRFYYRD